MVVTRLGILAACTTFCLAALGFSMSAKDRQRAEVASLDPPREVTYVTRAEVTRRTLYAGGSNTATATPDSRKATADQPKGND
jgi:hypothetical protein